MSKKTEKRKKKRDLDKYPALNQRLNAKTRFEVLDIDYLKKLDDAELKFMNQFMGEYVSGAFKKTDNGEYSEENFHRTPEERRECYTRNNTRNRCGLTVSNATGQTYRCDDISSFMDSLTDVDSMVDGTNSFSNLVQDEYDGDYDMLKEDILAEMLEDYKRCIDPKNSSDKKLAESNYGKSLLLKFKDIKLVDKG
jgi:hypothetical protein